MSRTALAIAALAFAIAVLAFAIVAPGLLAHAPEPVPITSENDTITTPMCLRGGICVPYWKIHFVGFDVPGHGYCTFINYDDGTLTLVGCR